MAHSSFVRPLVLLVAVSLGAMASCDSPQPTLPAVRGRCPTFENGVVRFTVDGADHDVTLRFDETAVQAHDGPLVLSYVAPGKALDGPGLERIRSAGGLVAEIGVLLTGDNLLLADQIVSCAAAGPGIDARRIHAVGYSFYPNVAVGAPLARQLGFERSQYIASVATIDGDEGRMTAYQDPNNRVPALIVYDWAGRPEADSFLAPGNVRYQQTLEAAGHYALLCGGVQSNSANRLVVSFLFDHPYRSEVEPYLNELPAEFDTYCPPPWKPYVN